MIRNGRNNQCRPGEQPLALVTMISLLLVGVVLPTSFAFQATTLTPQRTTGLSLSPPVSKISSLAMAKPSGAFFNQVPDDEEGDADKKEEGEDTQMDLDQSLEKLMKERNAPSLASQPSTINGVPTSQAGLGFGFSTGGPGKKNNNKTGKKKQYIGIGEPDMDDTAMINRPKLNDVTKPEYDDQGYTLYANEETGEKSRVFEALVEYPCEFTMKIVGANEGTFVEEILQVVADSCAVEDSSTLKHKTRSMGKWISVTVQAPVDNAQMLYQLYENVDRDPRVKFKF